MSRGLLALVGGLPVALSAALGVAVRDEVPTLDARLDGYAPPHTRPPTFLAEWISFVLSPGLATIVLLGLLAGLAPGLLRPGVTSDRDRT